MLLQRLHAINQIVHDDYGWPLARLSGLESLARSMTVTVLPLTVLEAFGSKEAVTFTYLGGSVVALFATLNVGRFESWMARRWVVTWAIVSLVAADLLIILGRGALLGVAIGLVATQAAIFTVCLSLFIMDYINRRELRRNESRRMVYTGVAWIVGPIASILLYNEVSTNLPYLISAGLAGATLIYFWVLRLGTNPVLSTPRSTAPSPLSNIPRFFRRHYLRVAYLITLTRGTFWAGFFIYAPLYVLEAGLPTWTAGGIIAAAAVLLLISPVVVVSRNRTSTRTLLVIGFATVATGLVGVGLVGEARPIGVVFWLWAAMGASWLDLLGNIPFMRIVKTRERVAMTTVFSSYRETASLMAPGLVALVVVFGPFWVYFFVLALLCTLTALACTTLPRRI